MTKSPGMFQEPTIRNYYIIFILILSLVNIAYCNDKKEKGKLLALFITMGKSLRLDSKNI